MKRLVGLIDGTICRLENLLIAVFCITALLLGVTQVVLRYALNTGFEWSEAVFMLLTICGVLAGAIRAVREDTHIRMDLLIQCVSSRGAKVLHLLSHISALALCAFYVYAGVQYVRFAKMMGTSSPETGFSDWVVFSIMPVVMAFFVLRYALRIIRTLQNTDVAASQAAHAGVVDVKIGVGK